MIKKKPKNITDLYHHCKKRLKERYGIDLSRGLYQKFINQIRSSDGVDDDVRYIGKESNNKSIWVIQYDGRWILAVYGKSIGGFHTFLPIDVLWDGNFSLSNINEDNLNFIKGSIDTPQRFLQ